MKKLLTPLLLLGLVAISLMAFGCGSKSNNAGNMDAEYYRQIIMLPDGQLLCSLEVDADKVDTAGRVYKVEKKDGKIRQITALYDGKQQLEKGTGNLLENTILTVNDTSFLYLPSLMHFSVLAISEDGNDVVYTETYGAKEPTEKMRLKNAKDGKPSSIKDLSNEYKLQYDEQGRCISRTSDKKRVEYGYTGDSKLPTSLTEYGENGKKTPSEIPIIEWDEHNRITKMNIKGEMFNDSTKKYEKFKGDESVSVSIYSSLPYKLAESIQLFYEGDNSRPISVRGYTLSGAPTRSAKTGVHEYAYRYDEKYNMVSVESLGLHGQPIMAISSGGSKKDEKSYCAAVYYAYNEKGIHVATATYDTNGRPVNNYAGYSEYDTLPGNNESFKYETIYFGALGQPVNRKSKEKNVPNYHRDIFVDLGDGESETHYFNTNGDYIGVLKFIPQKESEFTDSYFSKKSDLEKLAKQPVEPIILGKMGLMKFTHENKDIKEPTPPPKENPTTQITVTPNGPMTGKDLSLGKLTIGDSTSSVKSKMGEPKQIVNENGQIHWKYQDIDVTVVNNTVSTLISDSAAVFTPRGIHEGSPIGDVFSNYGKNYRYEVYNNIQLYEYPITSKDGASCFLRFAVRNGESTVYYISMRKL